MGDRHRISSETSKRMFFKQGLKTKSINKGDTSMRGGVRL